MKTSEILGVIFQIVFFLGYLLSAPLGWYVAFKTGSVLTAFIVTFIPFWGTGAFLCYIF